MKIRHKKNNDKIKNEDPKIVKGRSKIIKYLKFGILFLIILGISLSIMSFYNIF
ncbi:MAG: hypothetical protein HRT99_04050 [Mycoplasmatales bacterium]|nr:hypothetical protein [Mycoplasmatales bacterium]